MALAPCPPCSDTCGQGRECNRTEFDAALRRQREWQEMRSGHLIGRWMARTEPHACGITGPAVIPCSTPMRIGLALRRLLLGY